MAQLEALLVWPKRQTPQKLAQSRDKTVQTYTSTDTFPKEEKKVRQRGTGLMKKELYLHTIYNLGLPGV